jgi:hypothetical protein
MIPINLEVVSPFNALLTINASSIQCDYSLLQEYGGNTYVNENDVNYSSVMITSFNPANIYEYQYFITAGQVVHIQDKLFVHVEVPMNPNSWNNNITWVSFPLGRIVFQAYLYIFQTDKTFPPYNFSEPVNLQVFPTG